MGLAKEEGQVRRPRTGCLGVAGGWREGGREGGREGEDRSQRSYFGKKRRGVRRKGGKSRCG